MGGRKLRLAAACAAAFVFVAPASARHVDPVPQLALQWPAQGVVSRGWGWDGGHFHEGIDVGSLASLDVRAAAAGVVRSVGYMAGFEGYGEIVLVDVGRGFEVLYAHLSSVGVQTGDRVVAGQKLGLAGCTGTCFGTHLHFELRERGVPVDAAWLLPPLP